MHTRLLIKSEQKRTFGRPRNRWEDDRWILRKLDVRMETGFMP
jgi:hypothetical protein